MYFVEAGTLQVYVRGTATRPPARLLPRRDRRRAGAVRRHRAHCAGPTRSRDGRLGAQPPAAHDEMLASPAGAGYEILRASGAVMASAMRGTSSAERRSPRRVGGLRRRAPGGAHGGGRKVRPRRRGGQLLPAVACASQDVVNFSSACRSAPAPASTSVSPAARRCRAGIEPPAVLRRRGRRDRRSRPRPASASVRRAGGARRERDLARRTCCWSPASVVVRAHGRSRAAAVARIAGVARRRMTRRIGTPTGPVRATRASASPLIASGTTRSPRRPSAPRGRSRRSCAPPPARAARASARGSTFSEDRRVVGS